MPHTKTLAVVACIAVAGFSGLALTGAAHAAQLAQTASKTASASQSDAHKALTAAGVLRHGVIVSSPLPGIESSLAAQAKAIQALQAEVKTDTTTITSLQKRVTAAQAAVTTKLEDLQSLLGTAQAAAATPALATAPLKATPAKAASGPSTPTGPSTTGPSTTGPSATGASTGATGTGTSTGATGTSTGTSSTPAPTTTWVKTDAAVITDASWDLPGSTTSWGIADGGTASSDLTFSADGVTMATTNQPVTSGQDVLGRGISLPISDLTADVTAATLTATGDARFDFAINADDVTTYYVAEESGAAAFTADSLYYNASSGQSESVDHIEKSVVEAYPAGTITAYGFQNFDPLGFGDVTAPITVSTIDFADQTTYFGTFEADPR